MQQPLAAERTPADSHFKRRSPLPLCKRAGLRAIVTQPPDEACRGSFPITLPVRYRLDLAGVRDGTTSRTVEGLGRRKAALFNSGLERERRLKTERFAPPAMAGPFSISFDTPSKRQNLSVYPP